MSAAPVTAADVLSHLDAIVQLTRRSRSQPIPFSAEFMDGYLRALTDLRKYLRSENFPLVVAATKPTKETPTNAHRA